MICLINVFDDILKDFHKEEYVNSKVLSRRFELKGKIVLLVTSYKSLELAEISLSISENDVDKTSKLPKWKGMLQKVERIRDNQIDKLFISFKQSEEYDKKIYLTILQDIVESINEVEEKNVLYVLENVLNKWKTFFEFENNYVLSENAQQGLYGELYILEKMILQKGSELVNCWTGCNSEVHDFYLGKDALEVKSSSLKGPEKIKISNEYQLDDSGITGKLYLMYIKMRKSEVYGENLPKIVNRIMEKLPDNEKIFFLNKLLKVGYLYQLPELYTVYFNVYDENCYIVEEGFPRITTKNICKGIGSVDYIVSLDACEPFLITIENFYKGVTM